MYEWNQRSSVLFTVSGAVRATGRRKKGMEAKAYVYLSL
jgi:hypothetical protein